MARESIKQIQPTTYPQQHVKRIIVSQNLRKDLDIGRVRHCSLANISLTSTKKLTKKQSHLPRLIALRNHRVKIA